MRDSPRGWPIRPTRRRRHLRRPPRVAQQGERTHSSQPTGSATPAALTRAACPHRDPFGRARSPLVVVRTMAASAVAHVHRPPASPATVSDPDDLLSLSLSLAHDQDWTADLEDLVSLRFNLPPSEPPPSSAQSDLVRLASINSLQVTKQLHSKRSHPALPPPPSPGPSPDHSTTTPTSSRQRSPSQPAKRRPSAIPTPTSAPAKSRSASPVARRDDDDDERWETLQVGGQHHRQQQARTTSQPGSSRRTHANGLASSAQATPPAAQQQPPQLRAFKAPGFPPSAPPATPRSRASPRVPPAPASPPADTSTPTPVPRRRAVTQSPSLSTPASLGASSASGPSSSARARRLPGSASTPPIGSSTTASPVPSRAAAAPAPPRRKSLSAASSPRASPTVGPSARRARSTERLRAARLAAASGRHEADDDETEGLPPLAPWDDSPAPLVYRTSQGELAFAYAEDEGSTGGAGGGGVGEGRGAATTKKVRRPEDRVLPAVARRLEAERVAARIAAQRDQAGPDAGGTLLVSEWSREGEPRRGREVRARGAKDERGRTPGGQGEGEGVDEVEMQALAPADGVEMQALAPADDTPASSSSSAAVPALAPPADLDAPRSPSSSPAPPVDVSPPRAPSPPPSNAHAPTSPPPRPCPSPAPAPAPALLPAAQPVGHAAPPLPMDDHLDAASAGCCRCVVS